MQPVLATSLLLAMTLSHGASALCGHRAEAASTDSHAAPAQASDHAAIGHGSAHGAGHHGSDPAGEHRGPNPGAEHHGSDPVGEDHRSDHDGTQDRHECGALMDCGVMAVAPSTAAPSQWVGGSSFPLRLLKGSLESELPPTESPPPRKS